VFWSQHLRLRTSFESLDYDIAKELRDISRRLEVTESPNIPQDIDSNLARARIERIMRERRHLSARFDEIVDQVRLQPDGSNFLRNLDYNALSIAATHGPVAIYQTSWLCIISSPHNISPSPAKSSSYTVLATIGPSTSPIDHIVPTTLLNPAYIMVAAR
jgi:hypothetical protein